MSARPEFLDAALACGAVLTGKPDGSEAVTVIFTVEAWRAFDLAQQAAPATPPASAQAVANLADAEIADLRAALAAAPKVLGIADLANLARAAGFTPVRGAMEGADWIGDTTALRCLVANARTAATAPQPVAGNKLTDAEIGEMWLAACKSEITYANASLVFGRRLLSLGKTACSEGVA